MSQAKPASETTTEAARRTRVADCARRLQDAIALRLGTLDVVPFREEVWEREGGGGGRSLLLVEGELFEKAGVNFSAVHGELSDELAPSLPGEGRSFYATGLSLVLHPRSPRVPAVHANFRFVARGAHWWFGGGADLTPYRLYADDARHFHSVWQQACDRHDPADYARFKKWCDEYFYLPHRGETRGVGGIFFDYLTGDFDDLFAFWSDAGSSFLDAYVPIVERRRSEPYSGADREFQLARRGRYVEFNLLYDRGTVFGLRTGGRIESILMSLPPLVRWPGDSAPPAESPEAELLAVLRAPRDWL